MQTKRAPSPKEIKNVQSLPPIFVDGAIVSSRSDSMYYIRFVTHLPDAVQVQTAIMTSELPLKRIIDVLCESTNYYPDKRKGKNKK